MDKTKEDMPQALNKSCFVMGHTGEMGEEVVKELLARNAFRRIVLIDEKEVEHQDKSYIDTEQVTVDFGNLDNHADVFRGIDVGFCCIGTDQYKVSQEESMKVDHDYVLKTAELSKAGGCSHFNLVSFGCADENSKNYYDKLKGQVNEKLKISDFNRLSLFKPALLLCKEGKIKPSVGGFCKALVRPILYLFPTYVSVSTATVAKAMVNNALAESNKTVEVIENKAIHQMAAETEQK